MSGWLAAVCLAIAAMAAGLMSAKHIWALSLPGCGPGGGCDWAARSPWAAILGWPVAYVGVAFFGSLLVLWLLTFRHGFWKPLIILSRMGAGVSVFYLALMLLQGHLCVWCATTHIANLCWWGLVETMRRHQHAYGRPSWKPAAAGVVTFLLLTIAVQALEYGERVRAQEAARTAATASLARIGSEDSVAASPQPAEASPTTLATPNAHTQKYFGGRYWTGSSDPTVRIVVFQDYQCQLCKEVEGILAGLLKQRQDVAMSVMHWPFDGNCNPNIVGDNPHPGACFASRCAEAAGMVGGEEAFWSFHHWLVDHNGDVTTEQAVELAAQNGLDREKFRQAMQNPRIDSLIAFDINEGLRCGISFTPMIFVNGYEVRGWQSAGTLPAAIDLAAQAAKKKPKRDDRPDSGVEREFQEWLDRPVTSIAVRQDEHIRGPINAPTSIIMYGDISDPYNAAAYQLLEPLIRDTSKVCLIFRVFPLQSECNDMVSRPINERACETAHLLEAAAIAGGEPAYWKAYRWLVANQEHLPKTLIDKVAPACGVTTKQLEDALTEGIISQRILENIESAKILGVNTSPTIFVNGRLLSSWRTPGLLQQIIAHNSKT